MVHSFMESLPVSATKMKEIAVVTGNGATLMRLSQTVKNGWPVNANQCTVTYSNAGISEMKLFSWEESYVPRKTDYYSNKFEADNVKTTAQRSYGNGENENACKRYYVLAKHGKGYRRNVREKVSNMSAVTTAKCERTDDTA